MEQKNLILAIVLSLAILFGFQFFYETPRLRQQQEAQQAALRAQQTEQLAQGGTAGLPAAPGGTTPGAPSLPTVPGLAGIPAVADRTTVLERAPRIKIDATRVIGSIALEGGRIDDITRQIDPQSFDPNLKPEKSQDASLILRRSFGPVRTTASLFYQNIEDAIFSFNGLNQFGTVISSYKNVDEVRQYGFEVIIEATDVLMDGLDIDANASWMNSETVKNVAAPAAEGVMFPRIPAWRSNGNIRYRISDDWKASVGWRYGSRPNSDLFGLSRGDAYGFQSEYLTIDSRLSWDISDKAQIGLGIDNLFNTQAYVSHPLPQRTFVLDVKSRW
jgi:outer membrane receptor protein involved in Fe transport